MPLTSIASRTPTRKPMRKLALVLAGGFCGTLARYYLAAPLLALAALILPGSRGGFPYDIFAINLSGAFALGLLYGLAERGARVSPDMRLALGTGFLGAYTTFSTFTVGGDKLLLDGAWLTSVLYLAGSVGLGVFCAHLGHAASGALLAHRRISRRVRVRARRAWRLAVAPVSTPPHAARVQPWRLSRREYTHVDHSTHHTHSTHARIHASPRVTHAAEQHPSESRESSEPGAIGDHHPGYVSMREEETT